MAKVTKAVIPAAGLGTRFLPATKATPKELLPVVDKPAIQYVVEEAVAAGLTDICIVTGRGKQSLEDHFDRSFELEARLEASGKTEQAAAMRAIAEMATVHYVRQGEPKGLGHAIGTARDHVGDEPFAVLLPDDVMDPRSTLLADMLAGHAATGGSVLFLRRTPGPAISLYGSARVEPAEHGLVRVLEVVEKPAFEEAPSDLAILGRYVFTPDIFGAIERTPPGKGGEIQITDAFGLLMGEQPVYGQVVEGGRYDTGDKLEYLRAVVEFALRRDDLGPGFRAYLAEVARREGLS